MSASLVKAKASTRKSASSAGNSSNESSSNPIRIFLIGMMGSGKSFWGEKLKKKLGVSAYDLDSLVEMMEEKSIAEIFEEDGEDYFRKAESKMLRLFAEKKQFILSVGGGTPCHQDNMKWMNKHGITVFIDEPVETLCQRLSKEKSNRPLIKDMDDDQLNKFLENLLSERNEYYNQASHRLQGDELNEAALVKMIKEHA